MADGPGPASPVPPDGSTSHTRWFGVQTLANLAAKVTGKYYTCTFLENGDHLPLDEDTLKKIENAAFPETEAQVKVYADTTAKSMWDAGEKWVDYIQDIVQVGFSVSAILKIPKKDDSTKLENPSVSLTFEKQHVTSATCTVCPDDIWCPHVIAVIIYRIRHADQVVIHPPACELLQSLEKDQLVKVLMHAISRDPGATMCNVFRHIDEIRNRKSEMYLEQGVPDETFGIDSDQKSMVEWIIQQTSKDFKRDIDPSHFLSSSYPDTCNMDEKARSKIHQNYIQKVRELAAIGEVESAGRILIDLARTTLNGLTELNNAWTVKYCKRLLHDLGRLFSCFIVRFKGNIRQDIVQIALELNSIANGVDVDDGFVTASEWSDLDSLTLENCTPDASMSICNDRADQVCGAYRGVPFYQPVCASLIPDALHLFEDLLCGKQKPLTTSYDEKLPIMLLRFDALMHFGSVKLDQRLCNLGLVILRKLLSLSRKYSVIGCNSVPEWPCEDKSSEKEDSDSETVPNVPTKRCLPDGQTERDGKRRKQHSEASIEALAVDMEGMTVAQISYSLLYVCHILYQMEDPVDWCAEGLSVLFAATFRAMELGRFRASAPQGAIAVNDYEYLVYLDQNVQESYLKLNLDNNCNAKTLKFQEVEKYKSALRHHGTSFYGRQYAVDLLSLLFKDADVMSDAAGLGLALDATCMSKCPLKNLNIPCNLYDSQVGPTDLKKKWEMIIRHVFSASCTESKVLKISALSEFMSHIEGVNDCKYALIIYNVLKDYQKVFEIQQHQISCIKFMLRCIKLCHNDTASVAPTLTSDMRNTFIEVGQSMRIRGEFLCLVLPKWHFLSDFFNITCLKSIIQVGLNQPVRGFSQENWHRLEDFLSSREAQNVLQELETKMTEAELDSSKDTDNVTANDVTAKTADTRADVTVDLFDETNANNRTVQCILGFFEDPTFQHREETCEFLKFFDVGHPLHSCALHKISENYQNYTPATLLLLAKIEHEFLDRTVLQSNQIFSKSVFDLIVLAFKKAEELDYDPSTGSMKEHLLWWFEQIACSGDDENVLRDIAEGEQFLAVVKGIATVVKDCDVLVSFYKEMKKSEPLLRKSKEVLCDRLISSFHDKFQTRVQTCGTRSYNYVLEELVTAREECVEYVDNGGTLFKSLVLDKLRKQHKGKRKFLRLMDSL